MPLALQYELTSSWNLTNAICDLWVSFDVTCCTSSILNLCTISIDRYLAITKPLTYGVRRTTRRILSFIGAVWIGSCLISIPPVLILGNEHGTDQQPICEVSQNIGYQLYATLGAFYIPLLVMIVLYYKIYIAAKRVVDAELRDQRPSSCSKGGVSSSSKALLKRTRDSNKQTVSLSKDSKTTTTTTTTTNPHQYHHHHHHQRGHHHHTSYTNSVPIVPNTIVSKCDPHTIITATTTAPSDVEHNCCCCSNKCWYKLSPTTPTITPTFTPTTTTNSSRNGSSSSSSGSSGSDGRGDSGIFIRPNDDGGSTSTEKSCLTCCCGGGSGGSTSDSVKFTNNNKNMKSAIPTSTQLVPTSGTPTIKITNLKKISSKSKKTKDNKSNKRMTLLFTRKPPPPSSSTILMRTIDTIQQNNGDDTSIGIGSGQQSTNQPIATTIPTVCCNNDGATIGEEQQCCCVIVNSMKGQTEEGEGHNKTVTTPTNNCCDYYHYSTINNNSLTTNCETINHGTLTNCHSPNAHHNVFKSSLNFVFKGVRIRGRSQTSNNNCDNNNNLKSMNILHTNNNKKIRGGGGRVGGGGGKILSNENSTNGNGNNRRSSINSLSHKRRTSNALRERKASFTLGIIMTAFTVCWLPFFILALIKPFATSLIEFPRFVHSVALWLGYVNSMLNPIIYVTFHQDFRRAFKYLLCLQCSTMGSRLRAEAYRSQYGKSGGSDTAIGPHNTVTFASNTAGGLGSGTKTSPTIGFLSGSNKKISNGGSNDSSPNRVHHHLHHHHKQNPDQQRHHTHHHHHHHHHSNNPDSPATPLLLPTAPSIVVTTNLNNHQNNSSTNDMIITTNAPIMFLPVETTPPQSPPITPTDPSITNINTAIDCGIDSGIYTNNRHTYDMTLIQSTPTIIPPPPPTTTVEFVATTT